MEEKKHSASTQVGPSMAPKLQVTQGTDAGKVFKVKMNTKIGRELDNDVILTDLRTSRHHAEISLEGGEWVLHDLGSSNQTYLNDVTISKPAALQDGDRIGLGETEMVWKMPRKPSADTAPLQAMQYPPPPDEGEPAPSGVASPTPATGEKPPPYLVWIGSALTLILCLSTAAFFYSLTGSPPPPTPPPGGEGGSTQVNFVSPSDLALIYEDDFGDSGSGWDDAFDTYTTKQYGNNRYQIEVNTSNLIAWGLANRDVADFEIEMEAKQERGAESNSYGLLFRFQDRNNFYRFDVSSDGYYLFSKFIDGEWITLVDWTPSEAIKAGGNILKVSAFEDKIALWVNGQMLTSRTDDSLSHGNFGFFAGTFGDPYMWASFDNLKLAIPAGHDIIAVLPTATRPLGPAAPTVTPVPTHTPLPTLAASEATAIGATPTPAEPTPTPIPLPEYASRDQPLARGEAKVTGRILFPLFDPGRGTYDIYIANAADGSGRQLMQQNASQPAASTDGLEFAYRSWQPDRRGLFARPLRGGEEWGFDTFFESSRPQFSPTDKSLMYHSRTGGIDPAIYRVLDGIGQVMRREGFPIQGKSAKWGPDGAEFVYSSCIGGSCGIMLSNLDGGNPRLLTNQPQDTNPEISPDGKAIVFMSDRDGDWEIYRMDIDGENLAALTNNNDGDGLPTWSPDGAKVAFVSNRDGEWGMWDMDPDGGNQRRLFLLGGPADGMINHDRANAYGWSEENIDWIP
jgi:Tol biopolymer transport system component/pSer/pThr/pTyr-binding forkhead associated (FHA) protein